MMRIAVEGPSGCDSTPIASTPSGPVPMHTVTIPSTRDRVASGASVSIKGLAALCGELKIIKNLP
jgi:hypothetical protein